MTLTLIGMALNGFTIGILIASLISIRRNRRAMNRTHAERLAMYALLDAQLVEAHFQLLDAEQAGRDS